MLGPMKDRIKKRLSEYRDEALQSISDALSETKSELSGRGRSKAWYRAIGKDYEGGLAKYMDLSANFIRQVAAGSEADYANELRDAGNELKEEIIRKIDHNDQLAAALPGNSMRVQSRNELDLALDKLIKRKVEDFELGVIEGREMTAITNNTVNIINSEITNSVLQINQSGRDAISKETANKLEQLVNSDEIKGLPEQTRLEVLDQVSDLVKELRGPTDKGKVHRGLNRLSNFLRSVAASAMADMIAQAAIAYASANGLIP